jgi:serine/threonine protein kinase
LLKNIHLAIKKYESFGLEKNEMFMDLLYGMLDFNPMRRISPEEIINHPFIT